VRLVWVRTDAATLHRRLPTRLPIPLHCGSGRDTAKLAEFAAFTASMRLGVEPAAPHVTIDNRVDPPATLQAQIAGLTRSLSGG
jgi:hypothetical protein